MGKQPQQEPPWLQQWIAKNDEDVKLNVIVRRQGYPNRWGARIPIESRWNLEKFTQLLGDYEDKEVVKWLQYGWPAGRFPTLPEPQLAQKNHQGATDSPEDLNKYVNKEASYNAIMGAIQEDSLWGQNRDLTTQYSAKKGLQ